jgi:hypothetical protein
LSASPKGPAIVTSLLRGKLRFLSDASPIDSTEMFVLSRPRLRDATLLLVALVGSSCAVALAAPTPVTPALGAATGSRPTFSWTVPPNEQPQELDIAGKPDRTATGRFVDQNLIQFALFGDGETQWQAVDPLYAGHYWWLVGSSDPNTHQGYWSPLRDFRVRVALHLLPITVGRDRSLHRLRIKVGWSANLHGLTVRVRLIRRGRVIWQRTEGELNVLGLPGSEFFDWYRPPRIERGTRLTVKASLFGSGITSTRARAALAP